jgi:hypothetical protein
MQHFAHESDHVTFTNGLGALIQTNFDFTVGGAFDPFTIIPLIPALPKHLKILAYALQREATNLISTRIY